MSLKPSSRASHPSDRDTPPVTAAWSRLNSLPHPWDCLGCSLRTVMLTPDQQRHLMRSVEDLRRSFDADCGGWAGTCEVCASIHRLPPLSPDRMPTAKEIASGRIITICTGESSCIIPHPYMKGESSGLPATQEALVKAVDEVFQLDHGSSGSSCVIAAAT